MIGVKVKIGISSPSFALEPFKETIEKVSSDFDLWEIVADLFQLLPTIAEEFKEITPSYNLNYSIHAPFNDLNLAALNPALKELAINYIKDTIIIADELGIEIISLHPGHFCPSGVYAPDDVKKVNQSSINEIAQFAENYNIKLALENMPLRYWTLGNTAKEILEMIDGNRSRMGICFDVGHANIVGDLDGFMENIQRFYNIHIHDNNGRRDEHLILGQGNIDLIRIIKELKGNYFGDIIIECNNFQEGLESKKYLHKLLKKIM